MIAVGIIAFLGSVGGESSKLIDDKTGTPSAPEARLHPTTETFDVGIEPPAPVVDEADSTSPPSEIEASGTSSTKGSGYSLPIAPVSETTDFVCGSKRYCTQMSSCEEAEYHYRQCGLTKLDGDSDGIPCENVCGG